MNDLFLQERITATQNQIVALETALLDLTTGKIQQYTLNTGQGSQTVTKYSVNVLNNMLGALYDRLCTLEARLNGGNVIIARPV